MASRRSSRRPTTSKDKLEKQARARRLKTTGTVEVLQSRIRNPKKDDVSSTSTWREVNYKGKVRMATQADKNHFYVTNATASNFSRAQVIERVPKEMTSKPRKKRKYSQEQVLQHMKRAVSPTTQGDLDDAINKLTEMRHEELTLTQVEQLKQVLLVINNL